ncbi:hypothetical protein [Lentisalinibacter orientalis]|uniref:hypothetical protein n=1 Tax=Lentisalinibacter orientalis TaxID=2992241 RepID=UPI0038699540
MRIFGSLLFLAIISALVLVAITVGDDTQQDPASVSHDRIPAAADEPKSRTVNAAGPALRGREPARRPDQSPIRPADPSDIPERKLNALLERKPYREYQIVEIDSDLLREAIRLEPAESFVSLDLFGETVTLITESGTEHAEGPRNGYAVWRGQVKHADWSYASLRINPNGQVSGEIQAPTIGFITIESPGEGRFHLIWSMDDTKIDQKME